MELKNILLNKTDLLGFLANDFLAADAEADTNHAMGNLKFNMVLKHPDKVYSVLNKPVNEVYGYMDNADTFCIYMTVDISRKEQTDELIDLFGYPWNICSSDYFIGDMDMLMWDMNGFNISLLERFDISNKHVKLLTISNLPEPDLAVA